MAGIDTDANKATDTTAISAARVAAGWDMAPAPIHDDANPSIDDAATLGHPTS